MRLTEFKMITWKIHSDSQDPSIQHLWTSIPKEWFERIETFFQKRPEYLRVLNSINSKENKKNYVSLRKINFFITMYSKINKVTFGNKKVFVYHDYDEQLSYYRRKYFDPFRRGSLEAEIKLDGVVSQSTFPQLNFFLWFFRNGFYEYVQEHVNDVTDFMTKITREHRLEKRKLEAEEGAKKRLMYASHLESDCIALKQSSTFSFSE